MNEYEPKQTAQEVRLTRPFFLSDREISVGLFQQFMDDADYRDEKPKDWTGRR